MKICQIFSSIFMLVVVEMGHGVEGIPINTTLMTVAIERDPPDRIEKGVQSLTRTSRPAININDYSINFGTAKMVDADRDPESDILTTPSTTRSISISTPPMASISTSPVTPGVRYADEGEEEGEEGEETAEEITTDRGETLIDDLTNRTVPMDMMIDVHHDTSMMDSEFEILGNQTTNTYKAGQGTTHSALRTITPAPTDARYPKTWTRRPMYGNVNPWTSSSINSAGSGGGGSRVDTTLAPPNPTVMSTTTTTDTLGVLVRPQIPQASPTNATVIESVTTTMKPPINIFDTINKNFGMDEAAPNGTISVSEGLLIPEIEMIAANNETTETTMTTTTTAPPMENDADKCIIDGDLDCMTPIMCHGYGTIDCTLVDGDMEEGGHYKMEKEELRSGSSKFAKLRLVGNDKNKLSVDYCSLGPHLRCTPMPNIVSCTGKGMCAPPKDSSYSPGSILGTGLRPGMEDSWGVEVGEPLPHWQIIFIAAFTAIGAIILVVLLLVIYFSWMKLKVRPEVQLRSMCPVASGGVTSSNNENNTPENGNPVLVETGKRSGSSESAATTTSLMSNPPVRTESISGGTGEHPSHPNIGHAINGEVQKMNHENTNIEIASLANGSVTGLRNGSGNGSRVPVPVEECDHSPVISNGLQRNGSISSTATTTIMGTGNQTRPGTGNTIKSVERGSMRIDDIKEGLEAENDECKS